MLLPQLTELEQDTAWLTSLILRMAEATHHLATVATAVTAAMLEAATSYASIHQVTGDK